MREQSVNKKSKAKAIFAFLDYREFLRQHYFERKKTSDFSLERWARQLGQTRMAVKLVLDGKRHVGQKTVSLYADSLELQGKERNYFHDLVAYNKAKRTEDQVQYLQRLLRHADAKIATNIIDPDKTNFYDHWTYPALLECFTLNGFQESFSWLQNNTKFELKRKETELALNYFRANGFIQRDGQRDFAMLKTKDSVFSLRYKNYYLALLEAAKAALLDQDKKDREYFCITMPVPEEKFDLAKAMVREFRHQLQAALSLGEETSEKKMDRVIQINLQLFTFAHCEAKENR